MYHSAHPGQPVIAEVSDVLFEAVAGGQPVILVHDGQPAAVVVDYETWQEVEELASGE